MMVSSEWNLTRTESPAEYTSSGGWQGKGDDSLRTGARAAARPPSLGSGVPCSEEGGRLRLLPGTLTPWHRRKTPLAGV